MYSVDIIVDIYCAIWSTTCSKVSTSTYRNATLWLKCSRRGPVGEMNRLLLVKLPAMLYGLDKRLTNGCFSTAMTRVGHYFMNENHPLILVCQNVSAKCIVCLIKNRASSLSWSRCRSYYSCLPPSHSSALSNGHWHCP